MAIVTAVVPIYKEEGNLKKLVGELKAEVDVPDFEILLVYDESPDNTLQIAQKLSSQDDIQLLKNPYEAGFGWSIKAGFEHVDQGYVVPVMADLCDDPQTIDEMYEKLQSGYDVACGSRYMEEGKRVGGPLLKGFFSHFIGELTHYITGIATKDCTNAFKMYSNEVVDDIPLQGEKSFAISMQVALSAHFNGFRITEVPTIWTARSQGETGFNMRKLGSVYGRTLLWGLAKGLKHRFLG